MQCSLSVKTSSLLLRRRSHFWSFPGERLSDERAGFTVRGTPRSRPVLPFPRSGTNNALRLILFEASGTAGSSPLRGHRFLPTSHNTVRLSCSNTRMRSAVLSALSCFSAPIMRHSKSGGSYGMPVKSCRGWRQLTFPQQLQSFRMIRRYSVNVTILPFSYPLRYFRY